MRTVYDPAWRSGRRWPIFTMFVLVCAAFILGGLLAVVTVTP